jgi:hypothetical protein
MDEPENPRVKRLSSEALGDRTHVHVRGGASIQGVAQDRRSALREMHTNLMGPARLESALDLRGAAQGSHGANMRYSPLPNSHARRETMAIPWVASVERGERTARRSSDDDRIVHPLDRMGLELHFQELASKRSARHHEQSARSLVQAVNDTWANVRSRAFRWKEVFRAKEA